MHRYTNYLAALTLLTAGSTHAASFIVNSTDDLPDNNPGDGVCASVVAKGIINPGGGSCTLRAAIMEANALGLAGDASQHEIQLSNGELYELSQAAGGLSEHTGDLDIRTSMRIFAPAGDQASIDAEFLDRVFHVQNIAGGADTIAFENLTIAGGLAQTDASGAGLVGGGVFIGGGGLAEDQPIVSFDGVTFQGNSAEIGGAIYNLSENQVTINNSNFRLNYAESVAQVIYNAGVLEIDRASILNNFQFIPNGNVLAAVHNSGGELDVSNTLIGNNQGRGVRNGNTGSTTLDQVTVARNSNHAVQNISGTLTARGSLFALNASGCLLSGGTFNIFSNTLADTTGCDDATLIDNPYFDGGDGDLVADYALLPYSPAVDSRSPSGILNPCPIAGFANDLVGQSRPNDGDGDGVARCDAGALEYAGAPDTGIRTIGFGASCDFEDFESAAVELDGSPRLWRVQEGTYLDQNISVLNNSLTIEGGYASCADDAEQTGVSTIAGANGSGIPVFNLVSIFASEAHQINLSNLEITDGENSGIRVSSGAPGLTFSLTDSIIHGNFGTDGGGIFISGTATNATLRRVDFGNFGVDTSPNNASNHGGGLFCTDNATVIITPNQPTLGFPAAAKGGAVMVTTYGARFRGNQSDANGGAIYAEFGCSIEALNVSTEFNAANNGASLYAEDPGTQVIMDSNFILSTWENNYAVADGGAIYAAEQAEVTFTGIRTDTNAALRGGFAFVDSGATISVSPGATFENVQARGHAASNGGSMMYVGEGASAYIYGMAINDIDTQNDSLFVTDGTGGAPATLEIHSSVIVDLVPGVGVPVLFDMQGNDTVRVIQSTVSEVQMQSEDPFADLSASSVFELHNSIMVGSEDQPVTNGMGTLTGNCNVIEISDHSLSNSTVTASLFYAPSEFPDVALSDQSPAIDLCDAPPASTILGGVPAVDFIGAARPVDFGSVANGLGTWDAGAMEAQFDAPPPAGEEIFSDSFE